MEVFKPEGMNLELTTACPLSCPQCYCTLEGGKHMPLDTAKYWISQGVEKGVNTVQLSGGETMCYPYIFELVEYASKICNTVNVALSGYEFDKVVLEKLIEAGVTNIFISLNGSTREINSISRDGYDLAIEALRTLKESGFKNTYINWVMHSSNADDFENVVKIAEDNKVSQLVVLVAKPDSKHNLNTFPRAEQIIKQADFMKSYKGSVKLSVESCFSQLLALLNDTKLFGNLNVGPAKGCRAGRYNFSVSVDGLLSPCRNLDIYESFDTLEEYWNNSNVLKQLRKLDDNKREPCISCRYSNYCRHCQAINYKLNGELYIGNELCGLN